MYTHRVTVCKYLPHFELIVPESFRTTEDALGMHVDACWARLNDGQIDSFIVVKLADETIVAHGRAVQ